MLFSQWWIIATSAWTVEPPRTEPNWCGPMTGVKSSMIQSVTNLSKHFERTGVNEIGLNCFSQVWMALELWLEGKHLPTSTSLEWIHLGGCCWTHHIKVHSESGRSPWAPSLESHLCLPPSWLWWISVTFAPAPLRWCVLLVWRSLHSHGMVYILLQSQTLCELNVELTTIESWFQVILVPRYCIKQFLKFRMAIFNYQRSSRCRLPDNCKHVSNLMFHEVFQTV